MADKNLTTSALIKVDTEGNDKIAALVGDLRGLASSAGEAAPAFSALADELESLGKQNALVGEFAALKRELDNTDKALTAAAEKLEVL